jgi:hypothetical protein
MFYRCDFHYSAYVYVIHYVDVDPEYQVHIMGYVPYVSFATSSHANFNFNFFFLKKKKKKKKGRHNPPLSQWSYYAQNVL